MGKRVTVSAIKADIGAIGGHTRPSDKVLGTVRSYAHDNGLATGLLRYLYVGYAGDDIHLIMTHYRGIDHEDIHQLAWNTFMEGTRKAQEQGLYAAGQDLLVDAPSGNIRGAGPGVAEIEFDERPTEQIKANECIVILAADKTEPGAFNMPFYLLFSDPMFNSGLFVSPEMSEGFTYTIMDVSDDKGRVVELNTPEDLLDIAALLRDTNRYAIESMRSRNYPDQLVAAASTSRLHNIAGKYTGKDDPIAIMRTQKPFPATEELGMQFALIPFVDGDCRGSHRLPLMPLKINTESTIAYCNPQVSCLVFSMRDGILQGPVDGFAHPFFDEVRRRAVDKSIEMRRQGFFGPAMVTTEELEYGGVRQRLERLAPRFRAPEE